MSLQVSQRLEPTVIDRVVSYFDPIRGAQRLRARVFMALAGGYLGARLDRRATKEWFVTRNAADLDVLPDLPALRDRSRDLVRNAPIATGAISTVVQNVVGMGLQLQARPDWEALGMTEAQAEDWTAEVEREFRLWCESTECDLTRTQNFYGLQDLVFRSSLESGDVFVLLPMVGSRTSPYSLRLQVVEADRVDNPQGKFDGQKVQGTLQGGVELDDNGAPMAYHIRRKHPGSYEGFRDQTSDRIAAFGAKTGRRNVLHIFQRTRPGQSRGVRAGGTKRK